MNARRLQGWCLILSAVCLLIGLTGPKTSRFYVSSVIGIILFMRGIPAIPSAQATGWVALAGVVLLELSALITLGFRLDMVLANLGNS
jgi:hypothetical protein